MSRLAQILDRLEGAYGKPAPPKVTGPLEMILLENVAYLVDDQRREKAFEALRKRVGLTAEGILAAPPATLLEVARLGGMLPDQRVTKLLRIAQITREKFQGNLRQVLKLPLTQAKRDLKLYPGIGDPGAEKILLFSGMVLVLALESNGLRALVRLGFGTEHENYAIKYRSAQEAVRDQIQNDCAWLIRAHQLLRRHGQELCKRSEPRCESCPVRRVCRFYREQRDV